MTKKTPKKKPKADMRALIRSRYDSKAWALFEEVRNAAGFGATRSADAVAMSLWPSRGLHIHGIEIKSSRSDWMSELKNPDKSEPIMKYCDFWWLVADKNVAMESEIPKTWGFMVAHGNGLRVIKDAPKLKPKPLDCSFVAVLLKNAQAQATLPENLLREKIREEFDKDLDVAMKRRYDANVRALERRVRDLEAELQSVRDLEKKVGKPLHRWDLENYADVIMEIGRFSHGGMGNLRYAVNSLTAALDTMKKVADLLEKKDEAAE